MIAAYRTRVLPALSGVLILTLLFCLTLILRRDQFNSTVGARNLEASYHVLLTVEALAASTPSHHWYLPTVSLGQENDKNIPWGLTIPTVTGDYVYTSFPPPGFLAPYVVFKFLGLEPSIRNLALFNAGLGLLSALLLFCLLYKLLRYTGRGTWLSTMAAVAGCVIGLFSREALQSFGIVYWSHSLYHPILLASIIALLSYFTSKSRNCLVVCAVFATALIGPLVEWSAYIFNGGAVLVLLFDHTSRKTSWRMAAGIIIATFIAGLSTIVHFGLASGLQPAMSAFIGRFLARGAQHGTIIGLLRGYWLSYGIFTAITGTVIVGMIIRHVAALGIIVRGIDRVTFIILALAIMPLAENVVMMQHAMQFSFDRLKFIIPAALIISLGFAHYRIAGRIVLIAALLLASVQGYRSYNKDLASHSAWAATDAANQALVANISRSIDLKCAVLASSMKVRGYDNILLQRGIYENKRIQDIRDLIPLRKACGGIYLEGDQIFPDLPAFTRATILHADGSTAVIETMRTN